MLRNGVVSSGQCRVYTSAPMVPAANPAPVPAQRSRVGARSFRIHTNETNSGAETRTRERQCSPAEARAGHRDAPSA